MTLHAELLDHARELVDRDPRRPRIRAVSAAYYSVFHLLIANATRRLEGDLQPEVSRWFGHDRMKAVCGWFGSEIADIFIELQEARHRADYDLGYTPRKQDVAVVIERAGRAHVLVTRLAGDPAFELFSLLLLTGEGVIVSR